MLLWTYIVHALQRVAPDSFDGAAMLATATGANPIHTLIPPLLNALWTWRGPTTLILDTYHEISNPECHETMRYFLARLPQEMRVVIASRTDPQIGTGTLRARGELSEVGGAALKFTHEETGALLATRFGLELDGDQVALLQDRTEGWPAGLYLAARSLQDYPDPAQFIAEFSGQHRHIADYVGGAMLDHLSPSHRQFLVQTSVLERLCAPLCDAVLDRADSVDQLQTLVATEGVVTADDMQGNWYRCHSLLHDLLRVELERRSAHITPILHQRAAMWFRDYGDVVATMRHALAAPDYDLVTDLFVASAQPLLQAGLLATLAAWVDAIPDAVLADRPQLALATAWIAALHGRPPRDVLRRVAIAEHGPDEGSYYMGSASLASSVALIRAMYIVDDVGAAVRNSEASVASESNTDTFAYLLSRAALGRAHYLVGRTEEAREPLEIALRAPLVDLQAVGASGAMATLALVCLEMGERERSESLARSAARLSADRGREAYWNAWYVSMALGRVLMALGRIEEAETVLAEGVEPHLTQLQAWPVFTALALLTLAAVREGRGHTVAAHSLLDEARTALRACSDPGMLTILLANTERGLWRAPRGQSNLRTDLSEGEVRVLRLLASDLTQREIGRALYLSMNTVKTHTRSIYTKLDVASREAAIARARSLKLLA